MSEVADVLRAARTLIADETRWTTGRMARSTTGRMVAPNSPRAVCFCAIGAVAHVCDSDGSNRDELGRRACSELDNASMLMRPGVWLDDPEERRPASSLNDLAGHAEVLRMFDFAIERVEAPPRLDAPPAAR